MNEIRFLSVIGTRPNFVKLAALHSSFSKHAQIKHLIVHTGQHYDYKMNQTFFDDLNLPAPDFYLEVGSGSQAEQVGRTMMALEPILQSYKTDWVVIFGDVNATVATAITGKKLGLRVVHVEARH